MYRGDGEVAPGQLGVAGRHGMEGQGRLHLSQRPGHRHDPRRRRERLPCGDRVRARRASEGDVVVRDRASGRRVRERRPRDRADGRADRAG